MRTETEVLVRIADLRPAEHLHPEKEGFLIKVFFASSRQDTRLFQLNAPTTPIGQTLRISNIAGKELEFWLCTAHNKIVANATVPLPTELATSHEVAVDFRMTSTPFALVNMTLTVNKREIEKPVLVEADEELLKKVEDPYEKQRKEEEEAKKQREAEELLLASKQVKKAAITVTQFNKKDVPFF